MSGYERNPVEIGAQIITISKLLFGLARLAAGSVDSDPNFGDLAVPIDMCTYELYSLNK
jgi:hypothetical protein